MSKPEAVRNGHELAPLNNARTNGKPNVTIVVQGARGSIISRSSGAPEAPDRAAWSGKLQFFLSIIGYSVGLGNIWRFPYLCQQNGGGAFLIPFAVMLVLEGVPLFLIELGVGQKMRQGCLGVWNTIHPWLGGIGITSCIVTFFVTLYYNVIITWCFYYLFNSFQSPLPWTKCPTINETIVKECELSSETAFFWYRTTLDASPSMEETGGLKWRIVLCLLLAWVVVYFIMMKGIQSSGKVVYFTSMFPYIVLTIFFIRGITLEGAGAGLIHMYTPKVEKLVDPKVWFDAAIQVFYSFGLAFGSLIAFGSYNPPKNNCVRDVILVSICNAVTAIYASVVIFSILGFKAMSNVNKCNEHNKMKLIAQGLLQSSSSNDFYEQFMSKLNDTALESMDIERCSLAQQLDQAAEGTGLAFIVFTQAIVELPGAPFWAIIFFMMLLSLGLGSQIGMLEGMLCTIFDIDIFKRIRKQYVSGAVCIVCFLMGLIFCTGAGEYWLNIFDSFASTIGLGVVALLEMVSVIYIYGHKKFTQDIEDMTGYRPGIFWQVTWRYVSPILMIFILGSSIVKMLLKTPTYQAWKADLGVSKETPYPGWVMGVAVSMIVAGILPIPIIFLLRRFQLLRMDLDIHQGSIRRIETTVSTKEMITDQDGYDDDDRLPDYHDDDSDDEFDAPAMNSNRIGRNFKMEVIDF